MDKSSRSHDTTTTTTTADLIAEIAQNRELRAAHRAGLHRAANVGDRVQHTFQQHAGVFLGSAAALGLLLSLIPSGSSRREKRLSQRLAAAEAEAESQPSRRKQKTAESRSLAAILFGLLGKAALDMGKPFVMKMVRDHYLNRMASAHPDEREASPAAAYSGR